MAMISFREEGSFISECDFTGASIIAA
jgi:hypothetical protein